MKSILGIGYLWMHINMFTHSHTYTTEDETELFTYTVSHTNVCSLLCVCLHMGGRERKKSARV